MSQVNQVKDASEIVEVIGQRLDLIRAGASYKAHCPFHSEKTPSFFVNPQIQRYRCFGCGAKGDVFEFLQQYEGMSFLEALEYLADQAGIKLKQYTKTKEDETRESLLEILQLTTRYYHYLLTEHKAGKAAQEYLKQRQISSSSIELFNLGYALDSWDGLLNYLTKKKKFSPQLVQQAGLVIRNNSGRYYDRFRGRVIFPLKNHRGQTVGFSGRLLEAAKESDSKKQAKYINTPETQLYHKSKVLYGFSELFQQIRKKKEVVVCEGEFDVISSHQAHVSHVVAIKGSALTSDQAKLLERTVEKVTLALDSDEAGIEATKRAIEIVKDTNLDLRVVDLASLETKQVYHDADELIQADPKMWRQATKQAISAYEFLIQVELRQNDPNSATGRRQIIDQLAPVLNTINHQVEKDFYLKKLAQVMDVSVGVLRDDISKFGQGKTSRSAESTQQDDRLELDPIKQLEDYLLFLLFNLEDRQVMDHATKLAEYQLHNLQARLLLARLLEYDQEYSLSQFSASLPEDQKAALMEWSNHPQFTLSEDLNLAKEWQKAYAKYQRLMIQDRLTKLNEQIVQVESQSKQSEQDEQEVEQLLAQIAKLQQQLKHL